MVNAYNSELRRLTERTVLYSGQPGLAWDPISKNKTKHKTTHKQTFKNNNKQKLNKGKDLMKWLGGKGTCLFDVLSPDPTWWEEKTHFQKINTWPPQCMLRHIFLVHSPSLLQCKRKSHNEKLFLDSSVK